RLRKPTSKSTTTTLAPPCARAAPKAALDVVLPTPPLPDVTTSTLPIFLSCVCAREPGSAKLFRFNLVALKPHLHCAHPQPWVQVLSSLVKPVACNQLGFELAAENPGRRIPHRAGH